jgi:hypothetical protein
MWEAPVFRNSFVLSGPRISAIVSLFVVVIIAACYLPGCGGHMNSVSVAVTAAASTVDGNDTTTLTATVSNDHNSDGVKWSVSGGGTLSNTTTTSATYTAPAPTSSSQSVTITATSIADTSKSGTATITVPAMPSVMSTSASLTGAVGSTYSITLQASGGIPPYTWALGSGTTLPSCLTLKSTGVLTTTSGTAPMASCAGTYNNITFKITDSGTPTALTTTSSALTITITAAPAIAFIGTMPATGTYNVAYSGSAAATGGAGALTYSISGGALPPDLSLNTSTGAITGTPSKAADVGTFNFTIMAADVYGDSNTHSYQIVVSYPTLIITTAATLPVGYGGTAYSQTLAASGGSGSGYSWTVTAGGSQLTAVGLSLSSGGVLSGTTPVAGSASFGVKVTDSASNTATATFSVTINAGLTITTTSPLPNGYAGTAYSQSLAASGGSGTGYSWTVTAGASQLTAVGLSLSSAGVLSGTTPLAGTANFGVKVTDSASNTATASFSVTINTGLTITTATPLPVGYAGVAYTDTLTTAGGTGTGLTWSVTAGGSQLTAVGLSLSGAGVLSGATPVAGSATFSVKVTDSASNVATATLSVTINAALTITSPATLPAGYGGTAYSQTLSATGGSGTGYSWTVTSGGSQLTAVGLSLSSGGVLSGTTPVAGSASFGVKVTDSASNSATATLSVTIDPGLTITTTSPLPSGYGGTAYSQTLLTSGGTGTGLSWTVTSGGSQLTAVGLSLSSAGVLSGSSPVAGSASFGVKVTDSASNTATATFSVTINAGLAITTASSLPVGYAGVSYSQPFATSGGTGTGLTWTVTSGGSQLTAVGLSLSGAGVLSGATPVAGSATFSVKVTDSASNSATGTFSVTINAALTITSPATLPNGYAGAAYSQSLTTSGGSGTGLSWTVTSGGSQLTAIGLSLSSAGVLSGSSPVVGNATFSVKVTDSASNSATATLSVTIGTGLTITSGNPLPSGYAGTAYTDTLTAAGGTGTGLSWTVTSGGSQLAAVGLSLSSAGVLSGTTPVAGSASFGVKVTDSASNTATATFSVTINAGLTITTATPLPVGYAGTAYTDTLTTSGGSGTGLTWTVTAGGSQLTAIGLSLSGAGVLSGATPVAGSATFSVKVTDSASNVATATLSVTINAALTITTTSPLPNGYAGTAYSQTLMTSGGSGTGLSWTVTSGGSQLTAVGLSLSSAGVLSGSSPTAGSANFGVKVTDSASNTATGNFSVTVGTGLTITSANPLPGGNVGTAYTDTLTSAGGTGTGLTWTVTAGASNLTAVGLSLSSAGVLSGSSPVAGSASFTVKVTDSASNTATAPLNVTIYSALSLPAPNPSSLPSGYTGVSYTGSVSGSGGSGNLSIAVSSALSPSDGTLATNVSGATVNVTGTPSTATTVSFSVKLTDTSTGNFITQTYSITITTPVAVSLPTPNPTSLGSATQNVSYTGYINASGGVGPYTWSINGTTVTSSGLSLGNGTLTAYNGGGNTLTISGTPSATGTVTLTNVKVVDSLSTSATNTYTIAVNAQTALTLPLPSTNPLPQGIINQPYNGAINASGGSGSGYSFTVAVGSGTAQAVPTNGTPLALTDSLSATNTGGNTLTISGTPTAAATVTLTIAVTDSASDHASETYTFNIINPSAGYTVSGTVTYTGSQTGWVYLQLAPSNCNDCGGNLGTAISAPGAFTIHGVQPGTYTLRAFMDNLASENGISIPGGGYGAENASNPTGSTSNVTVSTGNLSGVSLTLANPSAVTLSSAPSISGVSAFSGGAFVTVNPLTNSSGIEMPSEYGLLISTTSSCGAGSTVVDIPASGGNGGKPWIVPGLTNGQTYYFCVEGAVGNGGGGNTVIGPMSAATGVTIGAPTGANTVSGTVTWTGTATGPLYVGFYDQNTGNIYADVVGSEANPPTSPASYSVNVPTGSNYFFFGVLNQNNSNLIGIPGQIDNVNVSLPSVAINSSTTMNLTLPSANSTATVRTQSNEQISSGGTTTSYQIDLRDDGVIKLPVAVELTSGPHVVVPADIATGAFNGDDDEFDYWPNINGATPSVGDTYGFNVTYSDGTSETLTASVTAVLNAFATPVSPAPLATGVSTTPNFSWTDPSSASSYSYTFQLWNSNGSTIWQIPAQHSSSNGFSSSITSITWDVDPTSSGDLPSVSSLNGSSTYYWSIQASDSNENSATVQTSFETVESNLTLPASGSVNALQNAAFSEGITATGGSGSGYVFKVAVGSGTAQVVPTSPSTLSLTDGLSATSSGNTLTISGTPTVIEAVTLNVSVTDSASHSAGPVTYTINVVSAPSGVNNGNLQGTYVCKTNGYGDKDGSAWASVSSMVANGSGSLTSGIWDTNGQDFTTPQTGTLTGTYSIGADNNGVMTTTSVVTSGGTGSISITWAVALTNATSPAQEFQMVETDDVGTNASGMHSTGVCYLATTSAFTSSTLASNSFVLSITGENGSGAGRAIAGRFTLGSSGSVSAGYVDTAKAGQSTLSSGAVTGGSYGTPNSTTGRATLSLTSSGGTNNFVLYLIDANRGFILQTDTGGAQAGQVRKQQQSSYSISNLTGNAVLYIQGIFYGSSGSTTATGYYSEIYHVSGNSSGVTVNQSYLDANGTYYVGLSNGGPSPVSFDSGNPGRVTVNGANVLYLYDNGSGFELDAGSSGIGTLSYPIESGVMEPQTQTTFTDAAVAGDYMFGQLPLMEPGSNGNVGETDLLSNGNLATGLTTAGEGDFSYDQSITGTYSWDTTATGTGSFLTGGGASGISCVVISSTKAACIFNTDTEPSVMILQQ